MVGVQPCDGSTTAPTSKHNLISIRKTPPICHTQQNFCIQLVRPPVRERALWEGGPLCLAFFCSVFPLFQPFVWTVFRHVLAFFWSVSRFFWPSLGVFATFSGHVLECFPLVLLSLGVFSLRHGGAGRTQTHQVLNFVLGFILRTLVADKPPVFRVQKKG